MTRPLFLSRYPLQYLFCISFVFSPLCPVHPQPNPARLVAGPIHRVVLRLAGGSDPRFLLLGSAWVW
ncbi:hypothetical protein GUJ93_ZPchr0006g41410 [Zizania palustris]|uniref:Uncharacterized protein n=1 Tax=Zizania palustris TaxID=103762 RepID=A0A8J5W3A9_ZIZPA|nr:hypothetical protein GUJ93_ZPchr0006g41410 [Zizania palustris]